MTDNIPDQSMMQSGWSMHDWIDYLQQIHPANIEMGLGRTLDVLQSLNLSLADKTVVTVAGTNGKGTTCRLIEKGLLFHSQSVAVYSSPHITDYKERLRINDQVLSDAQHIAAFSKVEQARGDTSLTFFEFATLAALVLIADSPVDYVLLEVGLGGRLDAVNVVSPDLAVITTIDLDHQDWLGNTREAVATEKAGILRQHIPAIIGEPNPPSTLIDAVEKHQCPADWQGHAFRFTENTTDWSWQNDSLCHPSLIKPNIPLQNASLGLQVLCKLGFMFPHDKLQTLLSKVSLPGRFETVVNRPRVIVDVAHNPEAVRHLRARIEQQKYDQLHLVVAMLEDKDITASLHPLHTLKAHWYVSELGVSRGASKSRITSTMPSGLKIETFDSVVEAYEQALDQSCDNDIVVVFGSFFTVCELKNHIR